MSNLDKIVANLKQNTPILMYTTLLDESLQGNIWGYLANEYQTARSSLGKVLISILNSIATQRRSYYCITRNRVRRLVAEDPNWKGDSPGFSNEEWPTILRLLAESQIGLTVKPGAGRRPTVYKVGDSWLKKIPVEGSLQDQEKAAIAFVENAEADNFEPQSGPQDGPKS